VAVYLLRVGTLLVVAEMVVAALPDATAEEAKAGGRYLGAISCSSSSCHGGAGERHNQFIVWSQRDFHARASLILTNARSTQIALSLGQQAAPENPRCTVCHAPLTGISQVGSGPAARPQEGVSCESCHGPAEAWLRSHTRRDYTYAMRVSNGMRDLRKPYVRANACVACHQVLERSLAAAGHPPLFFELATQSKSEPPHWRTLGESATSTWLTGQAVALRELNWNNAKAPDRDVQIAGLAWLLAKVTAQDQSLPQIREEADVSTMQQNADALARTASTRELAQAYGDKLARYLSSVDFAAASGTAHDLLFFRAKRLGLALEALLVTSNQSARYSPELRQLLEDVGSEAAFNDSAFAGHLRAFRLRLEQP
jgi:Cytochrome c554 and c-prime